MNYIVRFEGIEIVCPDRVSLREAIEELRLIAKLVGPKAASAEPKNADEDLEGLVAGIRESLGPSRLLNELIKSAVPLSDEHLRQTLGLQSNNALAGVTAGLTKQLKKYGFKSAREIKRSAARGTNGKVHYRYALRADFRKKLLATLKGKDLVPSEGS